MTDKINTRELALEALLLVNRDSEYSHLVLRQLLEKYQYLDKRERAFLTRIFEGTLARRIEMDYIISQFSRTKVRKMKPLIRDLLRMSVYQLYYMDSVPDAAVCNEAVKLAKKRGFGTLSGFVNGVLRSAARGREALTYPDRKKQPVMALSVQYSVPEWIVERWIAAYGAAETETVLRRFLVEVPITIRPNRWKTAPKALRQRLAQEGVDVEPVTEEGYERLSGAFCLSGYDHLRGLPSFREGWFYVQDISSMLAVETAGVKEGDTVIDVCAAPGGKSLLLSELVGESGTVEARDLSPHKVALIAENIARYGAKNITVLQWDATVLKGESVETADLVFADLPCSGLGVLRKKTDVKYRVTPQQTAELASLQRQILSVVEHYVKPNGTLLYSTCTINREENEDNVAWFLEQYEEFSLEFMRQMFPGETAGDGFFIAKLRKH